MTVGLPGTGIGAVFYILLAIYMPLFQLRRVLTGTNKARHWKTLASALSLSAIIIFSLYAEARLLIWCLGKPITFQAKAPMLANLGTTMGSAVAPAMAAMPFLVLFAIVMGLHFIRLMLSVFGQKQTATITDQTNELSDNTAKILE
jgi:multisubunit Na+/H+ antiporter MnhC subunit